MEKLRAAYADGGTKNLALIEFDVTDEARAQAAVTEAVKRFGRIDVLINNAGYSVLGNFEELTTADVGRQLATNFYGVVHVMRAALPVTRQQRSGHIINISSVAGVVGFKHCAAYGASKFAVEGLSMAVATEVEQFGIKITIVEPGFFRTSLIDKGSVQYAESSVNDYVHEGSAEDMWSPHTGTQPGNPTKLGEALVKIAGMDNPLKLFVAGSDALQAITPVVEERLKAMKDNAELSNSTDGVS